MALDPHPPRDAASESRPRPHAAEVSPVKMTEACPEGYDGTCLRPLGLCELGGSCEVCWYRPDHPRFKSGGS